MFNDYSEEVVKTLSDMAESVTEGSKDPLTVSAILKKIEDSAKELRREIEPHAISQAYKYADKDEIVKGGCKIELSSRRSIQYKEDSEYSRLEALKKNRADLLKQAIAHKGEFYDENGEIIPKVEVKETTFLKYKVQ